MLFTTFHYLYFVSVATTGHSIRNSDRQEIRYDHNVVHRLEHAYNDVRSLSTDGDV